ncbi:helix-turn-helix domain-containing protein [Pediococcus cellicola]|nr:helix-turn-helix domain-containing protein [Pediococcus cellicola]GEL14702.1 hypothetical protein PCE01_05040 [Pediococcus cellicola]
MKLSDQLRASRKQLHLTQQDLAAQLHVTRQTLSRWENDLSYPNLDTLVQISHILNLSLDTLLKGEKNPVVKQISTDVRSKQRYKHLFVALVSLFLLMLTVLILLGYGRATQNADIDRLNPFLKTQIGYTVLPTPTKNHQQGTRVDAFVSDNVFGSGSWLQFSTGQYTAKKRWAVVQHKGSYVSNTRLLKKAQIPLVMREQAGNIYTKYNYKTEGSRTGKKIPWWPFD